MGPVLDPGVPLCAPPFQYIPEAPNWAFRDALAVETILPHLLLSLRLKAVVERPYPASSSLFSVLFRVLF
jgi:hypothetical protein